MPSSLANAPLICHSGYGKFYICKYQNSGCPFYAMCPQAVKDHLSSMHSGTCTSQSEQPTAIHWTTPSGFVPETAGHGKRSGSSSPVSGLGLTFSDGMGPSNERDRVGRQSAQFTYGSTMTPPQLIPASFYPYCQATRDTTQNACVYCRHWAAAGVNGVTPPSWIVVAPRQVPSTTLANTQTMMNGGHYIQGQQQMPVQQQIIWPAVHPPPFQDIASPTVYSPASSTSSFSSSNTKVDMLAEIQRPLTPLSILGIDLDAFCGSDSSSVSSSSLPSTASWESLALPGSDCIPPNVETNSTPYFFPNTDNGRILPPQNFSFDFRPFS